MEKWHIRIADALLDRAIPFVFATGYDREVIPSRYCNVPHCEKSLDIAKIARALFGPKNRGSPVDGRQGSF
jgi:hypothetical protein